MERFYFTYIIIGATILSSMKGFKDPVFKANSLFNAYRVYHLKEWKRLFTHGFIHADWMHLGFNMYVLYMFGVNVESFFGLIFGGKGTLYFLLLYLGGVVLSSIYSLEKHKNNEFYNALGASGAVSAVVFAGILIMPTQGLGILFIPFHIPGWIFGILYMAYSAYMAKKGTDNIGHDAHYWGGVFGFVFPILLKPALFVNFIQQITSSF